jgi:outer membrane immunogenic protein
MKSRFAVIGMAFAAVGTIALGAGQASADGYNSPRSYVAPYNWSGIYGGVNAGWMDSTVDWAFNPAIGGAVNQQFSLSNDGNAIFGVHAGYQHQFGALVLGVEGALIDQGGRNWMGGANYGNNAAQAAQARYSNEIWTVGPRLGLAVERWMFFISGGYASTDIDTRSVNKATGVVAAAQSASSHNDGWYTGAGIEHALHHNIIVGLEYQHLVFNSALQCPPGLGTCAQGAAAFATRDVDSTSDVIRFRLTYKFGRDEPRPLK